MIFAPISIFDQFFKTSNAEDAHHIILYLQKKFISYTKQFKIDLKIINANNPSFSLILIRIKKNYKFSYYFCVCDKLQQIMANE